MPTRNDPTLSESQVTMLFGFVVGSLIDPNEPFPSDKVIGLLDNGIPRIVGIEGDPNEPGVEAY